MEVRNNLRLEKHQLKAGIAQVKLRMKHHLSAGTETGFQCHKSQTAVPHSQINLLHVLAHAPHLRGMGGSAAPRQPTESLLILSHFSASDAMQDCRPRELWDGSILAWLQYGQRVGGQHPYEMQAHPQHPLKEVSRS